ncbi:MAG: hypothetical protein M1834_008782 [Cirrosporium novae-zelandiae]|nr:MAG: hypothetical protein M1834_008782 [Cirrosporium novae-zelandiae]
MAVDPFAQQIIQYYSCSVMAPSDVATVPFSNNYTDGIYGRPTGSPEVDAQMQSAIYVGLLDPPSNSSTPLTYNCRTGNCTFPSTEDGATFLSLAFESSCIDISHDIQYSLNVTNTTNVADNSTYALTIATTSLPSGVSYNNYSGGPTVMLSGNEYSSNFPSNFLINVSFLMASNSSEMDNSARAFECQFFPAVNTYSANITNGILLEHALNSQRMEVWPIYLDTFTILLLNKTIRAECKGIPDPSDENHFPIITGGNPPIPRIGTSASFDQLTNRSLGTWNYTRWWPQDCVYYLPYAPTEGLAGSISSILSNESLYFSGWTRRAEGDLWAANLWNNGSATLDTVQTFMKGLTSSVTARWRQGDGISDNMGPANGTVYENATCVHVRWGWIALPAALLLLTIIFLLLTIIQTSLDGPGLVWKSSTLALLFNGLDTNTRQSYGPVLSLKEVKAAAGTATVQLRETGDGWRLVGM